jgi:hypothetical protein
MSFSGKWVSRESVYFFLEAGLYIVAEGWITIRLVDRRRQRPTLILEGGVWWNWGSLGSPNVLWVDFGRFWIESGAHPYRSLSDALKTARASQYTSDVNKSTFSHLCVSLAPPGLGARDQQ